MSNKKISILDMEKSNLEFKKSHYVSVSGFKPQTDKIPDWFKKFHEEEFIPLRDAFIESQNTTPKWFKKFYEEEFKPLRDAFIQSQNTAPKWFVEFATKQEQFNQFILDQFKKHGWIK